MQNTADKNGRRLEQFGLKAAFIAASLFTIAHFSTVDSLAGGEDLRFTILHTNDLHSHAEPFLDRGRMVGGFSRLGHLIKTIRGNTPNTLVVDAGDMFQGTPLFTHYHGDVEVSLLNKIGYDMYTIGNHEFDDGAENLGLQLKKAKFDVLSSNMDTKSQPDLDSVVKPYKIKEIAGKKVAFIGVMTPELERLSLSLGGVKIKNLDKDWIEPVREVVAKLKAEGITRIVAITHCGVDFDQQLAAGVPEIDIIIGGHSHTRLDKPIYVSHPDGSETIIVQTGSYGRTLGRLDVALKDNGELNVSQTKYRLINVTDKITEDPEIKAYVEKKIEPLLSLRQTVVSQAEGDFDNRWALMPWDSALGDLVTDALCEAGREYGATICLHNRGGMRGRIEKGPITLEKVQEILPFDNRMSFATITGQALLGALEHSVSGPAGGRFLDVHGIKLGYDPTMKRGSRLVFALAENKDGTYSPVDPKKEYKVAINNYTFHAGEGYDFKDATNVVNSEDRVAIPFRKYLEQHPTVKPQTPSRIVPITDGVLSALKKDDVLAKVRNTQPGSKVQLMGGTNRGATSYGNGIAIPLAEPVSLSSNLKTDANGELVWRGSVKPEIKWLCAIVYPPKSSSLRKIIISYPIELK